MSRTERIMRVLGRTDNNTMRFHMEPIKNLCQEPMRFRNYQHGSIMEPTINQLSAIWNRWRTYLKNRYGSIIEPFKNGSILNLKEFHIRDNVWNRYKFYIAPFVFW